MPIVNHFYNQTTRRYIALFGSLFNKMSITREDNTGAEIQRMVVPIGYGPYQKFLARITQDPNLDRKQAISLPRMSFEITDISYDGTRKTNSLTKLKIPSPDSSGEHVYSPAPYTMNMNLYVMTKYAEDGTKIIEQILPFFKPEYTFAAKILDEIDAFDLPLILNSATSEDVYDGDFETRRALIWTLSFSFKVWFFGPLRERKVIKFVNIRYYDNMDMDSLPNERITTQPGLTANGEPTTSIDETISYQDIEVGDDWGIITVYHEE